MQYKHLPHLDLPEYYQFITFRTADSADEFLKRLALQNKPNSEKQMEIDQYLDNSKNGSYLHDEVLSFLTDFFKEYDTKWYELVAYAVMPNHVHLLLKPLLKLSEMMQYLKGASGKCINDLKGRTGKFWARDYYDKAIRDENHFDVVYRYIRNNPLKLAGDKGEDRLPSIPRFYGIYEA